MDKRKRYSKKEKEEALRLKRMYNTKVASEKLKIKKDTINNWDRQFRDGELILEGILEKQNARQSEKDQNRLLKKQIIKINKYYIKLQKENEFLKEATTFFRNEPCEIKKNERIKFLLKKTEEGKNNKNINFYCKMLDISRQAFNKSLKKRNKEWKYEYLVKLIYGIIEESEYNDRYGRKRMYVALKEKYPEQKIPSEQIVYRVMKKMEIKRKAKNYLRGITKVDREAIISDDLLKRNFYIDVPYKKLITDITEIKCLEKKMYVSVIFDCYNLKVLGISVQDNMRKKLVIDTLNNAYKYYPKIRGAIIHSDRGLQYTSKEYRELIKKYGIEQSMNSEKGRCHDNARCEAMWGRMKDELIKDRYETKKMKYEIVKKIIIKYYIEYWNNIRISTAIGGITPNKKENIYYKSIRKIA